ncbi:MAG: methyltransferase [Candidatus Poseidoniales archaeon]|nr:methyltransferase [Candidatus Poseidoniales archaeon]
MVAISNSLPEDGYLLKSGVFSEETVKHLITAIELLLKDDDSKDLVRDENGHPIKIRYPLSKHPSFLNSLATPSLIELVDSLFPDGDAILTWEDILVKQPNSKTEVFPHQDLALQAPEGDVFSIGLSLHNDSHNPVFFLPGSHKSGPLTRAEVRLLGEFARDSFIAVETKPGDALIHDIKCVHYSKPMIADSPRYTWYLEFRSESDLRNHGPWRKDWIDSRKSIWGHVRSKASSVSEEFDGPLRIPHVTSYLSYDQTSPFNHFVDWSDDWKITRPHPDNTHHCTIDGLAIYSARYEAVLPFHTPGLAPVSDGVKWFYILPNGIPAFPQVFRRAFGFYCGIATVEVDGNWFHINSDGTRLYETNWSWCGNFQQNRCTVRDEEGVYHHIREDGSTIQSNLNTYAGDFREGVAVVRGFDGYCRHIDLEGKPLHHRKFLDLDVYHKGFARARDTQGWFHVDMNGNDISENRRYSNIEPFYNGQALVKKLDGELFVIDEFGRERAYIQRANSEYESTLNKSFTAYWNPLTVRLGILAGLTSRESVLSLLESDIKVIQDAWSNLGLLDCKGDLTTLGRTLSSSEKLLDRALYWTGPQLTPWIEGENRLNKPSLRSDFFELHSKDIELRNLINRVLDSYASDDWNGVAQVLSFEGEETVVDLGGGKGALLCEFNNHKGKRILVDRPEVIVDLDLVGVDAISLDIFEDELPEADVYLLSRILHDWSDQKAINLLSRIPWDSRVIVIDRTNDDGEHGLLSLNMLLTTGGRERNAAEWNHLFAQAERTIERKVEWRGHSIFTLGDGGS